MVTDDFFRARLDKVIDLRHPLKVLATHMSCVSIETELAPAFGLRERKCRAAEGAGMSGSSLAVAGAGVSNAGRTSEPTRLMMALLNLRRA